jgi:hypothetical protein
MLFNSVKEETVELTELLKGCRPIKDGAGNIIVQTIRNMQLVCLTTDDAYSVNGFGNPLSVLTDTSRSYGNLTIHNTGDEPIIIPPQSTYLTAYQAQDHATAKAVYIPARTRVAVDDSRCVESSQPGPIDPAKPLERKVLPFQLREFSWMKVNVKGYNQLWESIERFNQSVGVNGGAHIKHYFSRYQQEINSFIAHFERLPRTIGTIVLIDGEIVAIDKFPSFGYAEQIWDVLIRDCYGALVIASQVNGKRGEALFTQTLAGLRRREGESEADLLMRALRGTKARLTNGVTTRLQQCLTLTFAQKPDENSTGACRSHVLENEGYIGQVLTQSDFHLLVSVVKKASFKPERLREAIALREKARRQARFRL